MPARLLPDQYVNQSSQITAWAIPIEWVNLGAQAEAYCSTWTGITLFLRLAQTEMSPPLPINVLSRIAAHVREDAFARKFVIWSNYRRSIQRDLGDAETESEAKTCYRNVQELLLKFKGPKEHDVLARQFYLYQSLVQQYFGVWPHFTYDAADIYAFFLIPVSSYPSDALREHGGSLLYRQTIDPKTSRIAQRYEMHGVNSIFDTVMTALRLPLDERWLSPMRVDRVGEYAGWGGRREDWPALMRFEPREVRVNEPDLVIDLT